MPNYIRESGSQFPDVCLKMNTLKDIDDTIAPIITTYYEYLNSNDYAGAAQYLESKKTEIDDYWMDAAKFNLLAEEVYNIGTFINYKRGTIISETEPTGQFEPNTIWIQPIGGDE